MEEFLDSKDAIYHFTTKEKALEFILNDKELKLGTFSKTNDPQEYKTKLLSTLDDSSLEYKKRISQIDAQINTIIRSSGFLSFCENTYENKRVKQHGYKKARMWSHYSANHTGICLVFSKEKLLKKMYKIFDEISIIYSDSIKYFDVIENKNGTPPLIINENILKKKNSKNIALNYLKENHKKILFQKQWDYEGEREFRIILLPKKNLVLCGEVFDIRDCLEYVILGDSFHKVYIPSIKVLTRDINVPLMKLHWEYGRFHLYRNI